ncbi:hypothetical protein PR048_005793 [Dryococelus australis]|uniref:Uncharacterized protein n=1 Tax=Dryococelus australis TaxID=614101 RepID=A0ABQ9I958_9NEOP|nr:hypothetical protein PR048_005793 [Dryococelus australis]
MQGAQLDSKSGKKPRIDYIDEAEELQTGGRTRRGEKSEKEGLVERCERRKAQRGKSRRRPVGKMDEERENSIDNSPGEVAPAVDKGGGITACCLPGESADEQRRSNPRDKHSSSLVQLVAANFTLNGATVAEQLACSPPTQDYLGSIRGRVTQYFRMWESCRTVPLVGGFSWRSPISSALAFWRCSILASLHPRRLSRLCLNLFTHVTALIFRRYLLLSYLHSVDNKRSAFPVWPFPSTQDNRKRHSPLGSKYRPGREHQGTHSIGTRDLATERSGAVKTHWTRNREDPGSIPSHDFPKSLQANAGVGP